MNKRSHNVLYIIVFMFLLSTLSFAKTTQIIDNLQGTARIKVSRSDVNRLVFPYKIIGKAYSKEKRLQVNVIGKQIFIKFVPVEERIENAGSKNTPQSASNIHILYNKSKPAELYVITTNKTYSLVLYPRRMPPQTVYFKEPMNSIKKKIFKNIAVPYVNNIANNIIKPLLQYGKISGFSKRAYKDKYHSIFLPSLNHTMAFKETYALKGFRYNAYLYKIKNPTRFILSIPSIKPMLMHIAKHLKSNILAYSIFYKNRVYKIFPQKTATLVIVTQGGN